MFTANRTLTALDVIFAAAENVSRYDAVAVGEKALNVIATVAAFIVAVTTYVSTALQLFWLEHGESIVTNAVRVVINTVDFAGACYYAGRNFRPVANRVTAQVADSIFYAFAA
jgi:hypothetical protein